MPLLSRDQVNALTELITEVFSPPELEVLTRQRLDQHLYNLVDTARPFPPVVLDLIDAVEERGLTEEFIRVVYEGRKDRADVCRFCEKHAAFVFTPRTTNAVLDTALKVVASRVRDNRAGVRAALADETIRVLTDLGGQFRRLRRYKILHDCLHQLDFTYARLIELSLPALATGPQAAAALATPLREMASILKQTRPEIDGLNSQEAEQMWLDVGDEAVRCMLAGVKARNVADATAGFQLLQGLLRVQPTRINELLTGVLQNLALDRLRTALTNLRQPGGAADPLGRAADALGALAARLDHVLADHKVWQLVDNGLRQIESDLKLGSALAAVRFQWCTVARRLDTLIARDSEAEGSKEIRELADPLTPSPRYTPIRQQFGSKELRELADALTRAFETGEFEPVREAFSWLHPRARWYFFEADRELKALSEELDKIGEVLGYILKEVTSDGH